VLVTAEHGSFGGLFVGDPISILQQVVIESSQDFEVEEGTDVFSASIISRDEGSSSARGRWNPRRRCRSGNPILGLVKPRFPFVFMDVSNSETTSASPYATHHSGPHPPPLTLPAIEGERSETNLKVAE
jgi:hypothetical protein